MKERIANELGYELIDHRLELFGKPLGSSDDDRSE